MQGKLTSSSNMVTTNIYEPIVFTEILSIRDDHYGSLVCVYAQNITDLFKNCGFIDDFIGTDFRGLSENHSFKDEYMKFVADDPSNTIYY